jgi:hypothetical protein
MSLRAGPLSDDKVIALLNGCFVPVYAPYTSEETASIVSTEEESEIQRIWRESLERKVGYGMVHVYLLDPATGHPFDSIGVVKASITNNLLEALNKAIERYKVKEGKPLVKPGRQVFPSHVPADSLVLHLTARDLGCLKPGPTEPRARDCNVGNWKEFAAENAIVLEKADWSKLAPPQSGASWKVPEDVASKFLVYFYPQLEANVVSNHRVNDGALTASVASAAKGVVRVWLDGTLKLKRIQEPNAVFVEAPLVGYYDYDAARRRILTFRLVTENGKCGSRNFGVAVRSVAPEELTATAASK